MIRSLRATGLWLCLVTSVVILAATPLVAQNYDPYTGVDDPYWILLHEPAVKAALKLTPAENAAYHELLDDLDLRFFPLRNKSREEALAGMSKLMAEAREKFTKLLKPAQNKRLNEIRLWRSGTAALSFPDVAARMRFTSVQREKIDSIQEEIAAEIKVLEQEVADGKPREPREKKFHELKTSEQTRIAKVLKPEQLNTWKELVGATFDLTKLGQPMFKAPELVDSGEWINTRQPLSLRELRGKVVVIHFYACGCINCIHNYPWYHEWEQRFDDRDVVLIGIHTPETNQERNLEHVRKKATEEKFTFPVLLDVKSETWNAWGNSMWPSVYIIDQQGYIRHFWPGELKWNGNDGEKYMRERIEALLKAPS